jgi:DNA-binding GntR family transcriptional regulator
VTNADGTSLPQQARGGTSAERAYQGIKEMILSGDFEEGDRLPEDMIAARIGLSRTPIRNALAQLRAEGLISFTPNSGARVASFSAEELSEMGEMRAMLEGYGAMLAARKIGAEALDRLDALCDEMAAALARERPDLDAVSRINLEFHRQVAVASANSRLPALLEPLWNVSVMSRKYGLFSDSRRNRSVAHHREIAEALRAGDGTWARSVMENHILAARPLDPGLAASLAGRGGTP